MEYIKILIVEDEILIAEYIRDILHENGCRNIEIAHNVVDGALKMWQFQPDIILMDINLDGNMEGIALSRQKNEEASVIFLTGQSDRKSIDIALATSPESYLTKPIRKIELETILKIVVSKKKKKYIFVKDGYNDVKLLLNDILYLKVDRNYLDIFMVSGKKVTIRNTLSEFSRDLPAFFKQSHRSMVVNTNYITKISSDEITVNNMLLPLSRNFRKNFNIS